MALQFRSIFFASIFIVSLVLTSAQGQENARKSPAGAEARSSQIVRADQNSQSDDTRRLRDDLQRLKVLLGQMRANLAFVQTSQTPLKHQFELETDAWQIAVDEMERRLEHMERNEKK